MTIIEKIKKLVGIIVLFNIIAVICYLSCVGCPEKPMDLFKYNATLAAVSIGIALLVNYKLWKIPHLNKLFGSIPNIEGEWEGFIVNTKDNTKQNTKLSIKQTWFSTQVITKAERGNSKTISSEIFNVNDSWELYFTWNASFNGVTFNGTTIVNILDNKLDGYYFTNADFDGRKCTSGMFEVIKIEK